MSGATTRTSLVAGGLVLAAAAALVLVDRSYEGQAAALSQRLVRQRRHSDELAALRDYNRQTFVAVLERWLKPPAERPALRNQLDAMVEGVRQLGTNFATLPALSAAEDEQREQLINDLAAWSSSMSISVESDEGPEAESEIRRYFETVLNDIGAVNRVIAAAEAQVEAELATMYRHRQAAQIGFLLLMVAVTIGWAWLRARTAAQLLVAQQAQRERDETIRRQSEYFARMSHELRSPLVAIRSMVSEIDDDAEASESARTAARDIHREAGELLDLINNILDAAKLEARQISLLFEPVGVEAVLERCLVRGRALMRGKPVEIAFEIDATTPPVHGDFIKLQQIFTNLVANAVKFTAAGKVTVRARPAPHGVIVEVADTGVGMSAQQLEHIWEPFQQGDGGIARNYGGTGLGLSIVKGLVELHRGSISVESTPEVGTTFRVSLPAAPAQSAAAPSAA